MFGLFSASLCCTGAQVTASEYISYNIRTIVGDGNNELKVNVAALEASIGRPNAIVQSKKGDLYLTSYSHHVVLKVEFNERDETPKVTILAGIEAGTGERGIENVPGIDSHLNNPRSLALVEDDLTDEVIAILIVDEGNSRIRKLDMATGLINTIVGNGRNKEDGGLAINAAINGPKNIYFDKSTGDMFIVEYWENRIRRVFASNDTITTVVGSCTVTDGNGDGGRAVDACLLEPTDFIMNDAGEWFIIIMDGGGLIRKVGLDGIINTFPIDVQLESSQKLAFTPSGELLVAETGAGNIRAIDKHGSSKTIAGGGSVIGAHEVPATEASITPYSVVYTSKFGILFSDWNIPIFQNACWFLRA